MNITMYDCGFGDCFRLENDNSILYVDFGIHSQSMGKSKREQRYVNIINNMPDNCDFLLTHYHDDHYAGALYMAQSQSGKRFRNVYIPDIWKISDSINVIKLTLLRGLLKKSVLKKHLSLIDFLIMICKSSGKIYFVKRGDYIQNKYVALWPDEAYVSNKTRDLYMQENSVVNGWEALTQIAERLRDIVIRMADGNESNMRQEILQQLQVLNEEYYQLGNNNIIDRNSKSKLYKYGNDISIVFQNKNDSLKNILFTGDVGRKCWECIINNLDGKVSLYNNYEIIKIPHHGTKAYYHKIFSMRSNSQTKLLIPNGTIHCTSWYVYKKYLQDASATNSLVVCSDDKVLNTIHYNCRTYIIAYFNYFYVIFL